MNATREYDIIARILQGEYHAYALLVDAYKGPIFNLAYRMTGNRHDADDLAQEAFITAYENISSFDRGRKFFTWLYTIALNIIRNHLKKIKVSSPPVDPELSAQTIGESFEDAFMEEEKYRCLDLCMHQLPDEMSEAIVLRFYQGLSFEDIAAITDLSLSAVKMRVYRGLQKLHSLMEPGP